MWVQGDHEEAMLRKAKSEVCLGIRSLRGGGREVWMLKGYNSM